MDTILTLIWQQYGGPWLLGALALAWLLHSTGLVRWLIDARGEREEREAGERQSASDRLSADQQVLMTTLIQELSDVRARHRVDMEALHARHHEEIEEWRAWNAKERERADLEMKNAQRWRHLLGQFGSVIYSQRRLLDRAGIPYPRVDFSEFIAAGGDVSQFEGL